ncbi:MULTISPECIES: bacterial transcriptional activator domain-containing protein [unclassified Streptomyces]|uniref:AfsR/SARP family transcriptional regulator n=1 Tax=unclassified Streptomyces TaxID=2593676 RepID=UPI00278C2B2E|nr:MULTISPECIES: bacterial transcriptional activator domain-containing protein [unclassified Streptomyces]
MLVSEDDPVTLSPGATMLCAYLALAPKGGRLRSVAAAQLFADCSESAARHRLNTALWRLRSEARSTIGVDLVASNGDRHVGLSSAVEIAVDATDFEDLVSLVLEVSAADMTEADASRLRRAISLYRGKLLEPCDDAWVLSTRNRLENLYLTALDYLLQYSGSRGEVEAVAKYGELALCMEPLREDVHRHLMSAYGAAGRDDLVERQFERCRMVLLSELGADPMPETIALYARLTRNEHGRSTNVAALVAELERARREVRRLADIVDRALDRLRYMT